MKLPDTKITVVHRSDESGTTKGFTTFLADYSPSGRARSAPTRPSSGRPARAPRATTASPLRSSRPTAPIGYVEQAYALQNNFTTADVKNKSGKFIAPTLDVDVGGRRGPRRSRRTSAISTIDSPNPAAYPIASADVR